MIPGSPQVWERLAEASEGFSRPVELPGFFRTPPCTEQELAEVLRARPSLLQAYGEGGLRLDHRERILADPPRPDEPLQAWAQRLFEGRRFGMVVQKTEGVSERLARRFATFLGPLARYMGVPPHGITINFFVGNYGLTPFGIHHDTGMQLMHFHLGPAPKELLMWSPEDWLAVYGSPEYCHRPEPYLASAPLRFVLRPGSLFYFPGTYRHIGNAREFSVAVAVVMVGPMALDVLRIALGDLLALEDAPTRTAGLERMTELALEHESGSGTAETWLRDGLSLFRSILHSNAHLAAPPRPLAHPVSGVDGPLVRVAPFRLLIHRTSGGRIAVLARGRAVAAPLSPALERAIERLEHGEAVELVRELEPAMGRERALHLASTLASFRAVEPASEARSHE